MSTEPIDFAAVKAKHKEMHSVFDQPMGWCAPCNATWPCLAHRLAVEVERFTRTVATEPERTRAAVVKALRKQAARLREYCNVEDAEEVESDADAIEDGADW